MIGYKENCQEGHKSQCVTLNHITSDAETSEGLYGCRRKFHHHKGNSSDWNEWRMKLSMLICCLWLIKKKPCSVSKP